MAKLRKALVVGVGAITILSMSMLMVPVQVGAAAVAGDLIKMSGLSSVYYLGADGKRYVFPNEATYFSWYSDFSKVVTISQSELEALPLGKNVTVRPGTKLVKITTNPKVYAVTPGGVLIAIPDEATAKTLWGDNWAKRVIDVPDAFFTNYTIGSASVNSAAYPAGSIIKYASAPDVYYIAADGKAQKITSEAAFLANGFKWSDIVTAPTSVAMPALGTDIAGKDSAIADTSSGAGGSIYTGGTGLTVSLSGDTPASRNVPSYSTLVPWVTVNLTASNDGAVTVDQMTFTRKGTGEASDFDGGYLYSGDTILSTKRSVNTSDHNITFNALNLTIPAGATKSVTLRMNAKTSGTVNGNHYFELTSASAVSATGVTVSGSFPVAGNLMSYSTVSAGSVTLANSYSATNYKIGETNRVVAEFTINNDSYEDSNVYRVRLRNYGDASDGAMKNYSLDLDGTVVKSDVQMSGKYIDFVLDTPFKVKKSTTITATVRADIMTDINKYISLSLKDKTDFDARGTAYGDFYSLTVVNTNFNGVTSGTDYAPIQIKGSEINLSSDGPAAADYKDNTKDVVLANIKISSANEDVNFEYLNFTLNQGGTNNGYPLQNLELVDSTNNAAYSVADPASSSAPTLAFENVYLKKGVEYNFQLRGDIQDDTPAGSTFYVTMNTTGTNQVAYFQDADQTLVVAADYSSSGFTGKTMTVAAPTIYFAKVSTTNANTVQSATNVLLYKGKITATNVDNLKVSRVKINTAGVAAGQLLSTDFQRLYLNQVNSDGSETRLATETSLAAATISFSGFTLNIPKGLSNGVYVTVRADVKSTPTATTTAIAWDGTYTNYTVRDSDNNAIANFNSNIATDAGHSTTVTTKGAYTLDFDTTEAGINNNMNVLAGQIVKVGRIKATAQKEAAIINDLVIQNSGTATNQTAARVYLYSDSAMTQLIGSADFANISAGSDHRALLQGINYNIPTTGNTYIYVGVLVKPIDYSNSPSSDATGVASTTIYLNIPDDNAGLGYSTKATGAATDATLDDTNAAPSANSSVTANVMGATMSNITSDFANGLLANGTAKDIFSFKVTAPASTNVDYDGTALGVKVTDVTFTIASTTGITLSDFKIERVGGANGERNALNADGGAASVGAGTFVIGVDNSYASGTLSDAIVKPGQTATYVVKATIAGVSSNSSLQVTIESTSDGGVTTPNVKYTHNYGVAGLQGADITEVYPLISGITSVRGGSLTN